MDKRDVQHKMDKRDVQHKMPETIIFMGRVVARTRKPSLSRWMSVHESTRKKTACSVGWWLMAGAGLF
jgi:hypothetical protein